MNGVKSLIFFATVMVISVLKLLGIISASWSSIIYTFFIGFCVYLVFLFVVVVIFSFFTALLEVLSRNRSKSDDEE